MKLAGRNDLVLLAGLAVALLVIVFSAPLESVFEAIEDTSGLRLLPALLILASVLVFHQLRKRQEMYIEARAATARARQAAGRAAEMERLVGFGHALARSLNAESIQSAVTAHIPLLAPGRDAWVLACPVTRPWTLLTTVGDSTPAERERAARAALGGDAPDGRSRFTCFPMINAGTPLGVLAVASEPPLVDQQRRILATTAALLGASLKNAELFNDLHEHSVRDALTGCYNRRHALEVIDGELRRARRSQMPLSLVMFDLDHFKQVNDRYGHLGGDAVLAAVGARLKTLRGSDVKCRYGGEEFLILLPDTPLPGALRVVETLRREIAEHPVLWNGQAITVTASFGVTAITPGEIDPLVIMSRADHALYRAKEAGRNCVRVADHEAALEARPPDSATPAA
jgi:diguanylate cyclase (GGDEF)-like protein